MDRDIFTRKTTNGQLFFNKELLSDSNDPRVKIYIEDLKKVTNRLFLTDIVSNKDELYRKNPELVILRKVFSAICNIHIAFPDTPISGYECFSAKYIDKALEAITSFRTGISNVNKKPVSREQALDRLVLEQRKSVDDLIQKIVNSPVYSDNDTIKMDCNGRLIYVTFRDREPSFSEVTFEHFGIKNVEFSIAEESEGTRRLLDLLAVLFSEQDNSVFIFDELDRSLHPQLTIHFVQTFLKIAEKRNIQLLMTTHESHLLNLDLLRQDEIFFVDVNSAGESILYPFDRFKQRFDKKIEKAYLGGR